jgi:hypothetical protein
MLACLAAYMIVISLQSTQRTEAFKRHAKEMEDEERCLQVVGGVECRARA